MTGLEAEACRAATSRPRSRRPSKGWSLPKADLPERCVQGFVALVFAAALGLGVYLTPDAGGVNTHTQLGLPPCGMLAVTGHPCPTCGVTTAFALAAHGRVVEAFVTQPFGLTCFLVCLGGLLATGATLATGRSWVPLLTMTNILAACVILSLILLISWAYKWSVT